KKCPEFEWSIGLSTESTCCQTRETCVGDVLVTDGPNVFLHGPRQVVLCSILRMDKYHIYEEVGSGQHSQVFKGREKMGIEYVAIKRIRKGMMTQVVNEVQVIHRLSSPNVLKFYDWYETRNNVWLILEYCTGGDLLTLIKQDKREPESSVRLFGVDMLAGLQQTHACGFLHRDLKPSNILVDEYGILKLSGFGLACKIPTEVLSNGNGHGNCSNAKELDKQLQGGDSVEGFKSTFQRRGTPTYMAPELFSKCGTPSFASDFWSIGCMLFELLTGQPPFMAESLDDLIEQILEDDPPGLDQGEWKGTKIGHDFSQLVRWLLAKDPLRRPTWSQLLSHAFWGTCQTPSPMPMPTQPLLNQARALVEPQQGSKGCKDEELSRIEMRTRAPGRREGVGGAFSKAGPVQSAAALEGCSKYSKVTCLSATETLCGGGLEDKVKLDHGDTSLKRVIVEDADMQLDLILCAEDDQGGIAAPAFDSVSASHRQGRGSDLQRVPTYTQNSVLERDVQSKKRPNPRKSPSRSMAAVVATGAISSQRDTATCSTSHEEGPPSADQRDGAHREDRDKSVTEVGFSQEETCIEDIEPKYPDPYHPRSAVQRKPASGHGSNCQSGSGPVPDSCCGSGSESESGLSSFCGTECASESGQGDMRGLVGLSSGKPSPIAEGGSPRDRGSPPVSPESTLVVAGEGIPVSARAGDKSVPDGSPCSSKKHGTHATDKRPNAIDSLTTANHPRVVAKGNSTLPYVGGRGSPHGGWHTSIARMVWEGESGEDPLWVKHLRTAQVDVRDLLIHTSDAQVTPIAGNETIEVQSPIMYVSEALPFEAHPLSAVSDMSQLELETFLTKVYTALSSTATNPHEKVQMVGYLHTLVLEPAVANLLVNSTFLLLLLRMMRRSRPPTLQARVSAFIGVLVRHATYISPKAAQVPVVSRGRNCSPQGVSTKQEGCRITEENDSNGGLMTALVAAVMEGPTPGHPEGAHLRRNAMAALGELLFYISTQDGAEIGTASPGAEGGKRSRGNASSPRGVEWHMPSTVTSAVMQCLRDSGCEGVQYYAAKTVENVLAQAGPNRATAGLLVNWEIALCLLDITRFARKKLRRP
ncbi:unnamed protein product, partial [Choristocarpus tenellus]